MATNTVHELFGDYVARASDSGEWEVLRVRVDGADSVASVRGIGEAELAARAHLRKVAGPPMRVRAAGMDYWVVPSGEWAGEEPRYHLEYSPPDGDRVVVDDDVRGGSAEAIARRHQATEARRTVAPVLPADGVAPPLYQWFHAELGSNWFSDPPRFWIHERARGPRNQSGAARYELTDEAGEVVATGDGSYSGNMDTPRTGLERRAQAIADERAGATRVRFTNTHRVLQRATYEGVAGDAVYLIYRMPGAPPRERWALTRQDAGRADPHAAVEIGRYSSLKKAREDASGVETWRAATIEREAVGEYVLRQGWDSGQESACVRLFAVDDAEKSIASWSQSFSQEDVAAALTEHSGRLHAPPAASGGPRMVVGRMPAPPPIAVAS